MAIHTSCCPDCLEGWIENVEPIGDSVAVTLSLSDGCLLSVMMAADQADWLELRVGQIVNLLPDSVG
jgi:hypothetical protein